MRHFALLPTVILCAVLTFAPVLRAAEFTPAVGQPGKDVIWVPTPETLIARMLEMAKVTPRDYLVDLGSGDGRTVIAAAQRGIKALGIEYHPDMVALSTRSAQAAGVSELARFIQGDIFTTDFSEATVVTMYLLSSLNLKLRPILLNMKPGTRVVSHAFNMGDWPPDETASVEGYNAYLWIVPARIQGRWQVSAPNGGFELGIEQIYQKFNGKAAGTGGSGTLSNATLQGNAISFTVADSAGRANQFLGAVSGDVMEGTVRTPDKAVARWSARRLK